MIDSQCSWTIQSLTLYSTCILNHHSFSFIPLLPITMDHKSIISLLSLLDTIISPLLLLFLHLSISILMMVGSLDHSSISPLLFNSPSLQLESLEEVLLLYSHSLLSSVLLFKVSSLFDFILNPINLYHGIYSNLNPLPLYLQIPSLLSLDIISLISVSIKPSIHSNSVTSTPTQSNPIMIL